MEDQKTRNVKAEEAIKRIKEHTKALPTVCLPLQEVARETAAEDVYAAIDQPPFPRSPLDGYALRGEDSKGASPGHGVKLKVVDRFCAGEYRDIKVGKGECIRIMTGACIPFGADAVIRQEDTDYGEETVCLYQEVKPWQNYCYKGEDYKKGKLLIPKGTTLDYAEIAVLASNGIAALTVHRKPRVLLLSTGDEVVEPGQSLKPGKIYNSNLFLLRARLRQLGICCEALHCSDDKEEVKKQIGQWHERVDAVITTGGVSVGEKDIMNEVLKEMDIEVLFDGVLMKPGSPAKYGLYHGMPVLALSGNPFAASVTFELFGRAMLSALMASHKMEMVRTKALMGNSFGKASKMRRFIRGRLEQGRVFVPDSHSSGQILSMLGCNCLVDIPEGSNPLQEGDEAEILLL